VIRESGLTIIVLELELELELGQILGFYIELRCRPYNTLALPCECVILYTNANPHLRPFLENVKCRPRCCVVVWVFRWLLSLTTVGLRSISVDFGV